MKLTVGARVFISWLLLVTASFAVQPPPQARVAGFSQLVFDEEFNGPLDIGYGTSGHKWNAGLWWEQIPSPTSFLKHGRSFTITASNPVDLCTQYHNASGGTYFLGGYFEAEMLCTDWSAFWLFCADRPFVWGSLVLASDPLTWTNEIDIIETDPGSPDRAWCTLHANSSSNTVPDKINLPNSFLLTKQLVGEWHIYGLLWTQAEVSWYIDNVKVASVAPFASTWQPVQLILTASPGGVNGSPSTVVPPITQVRWVRVWR